MAQAAAQAADELTESDAEIERSAPKRVDLIDARFDVLACLADVHGNTVALDAVLASEEFAGAQAVAFLGCSTSGPDPLGVLERCRTLSIPVFHLAGNGDRWLLELADGVRPFERELDTWLIDSHGEAGLETIGSWPGGLAIPQAAAGGVRLCHGSPRSDIELLTRLTPGVRLDAATEGVAETTVIHGHSHVQYSRQVDGRTIAGAGSVGLPYSGGESPGARWALVSDRVQLVVTPYDLDGVDELVATRGYPSTNFSKTLREPPTAESMTLQAEELKFSN